MNGKMAWKCDEQVRLLKEIHSTATRIHRCTPDLTVWCNAVSQSIRLKRNLNEKRTKRLGTRIVRMQLMTSETSNINLLCRPFHALSIVQTFSRHILLYVVSQGHGKLPESLQSHSENSTAVFLNHFIAEARDVMFFGPLLGIKPHFISRNQ
jgi:hypothetical protein